MVDLTRIFNSAIGLCRIGENRIGEEASATALSVVDLRPEYSIELWNSHFDEMLYWCKQVSKAGYTEAANKSGELTLEFPDDAEEWDYFVFGCGVRLIRKGEVFKDYINWGAGR